MGRSSRRFCQSGQSRGWLFSRYKLMTTAVRCRCVGHSGKPSYSHKATFHSPIVRLAINFYFIGYLS
jgi:hypothetical protein